MPSPRSPTDEPRPGDFLSLDLDLLDDNPFQPRKEMDPAELEKLATTLAQSGQLQPIAVRPVGPGRYQIVAGHRRVGAFRQLLAAATTDAERRRWELIRAHVVAATTDSQMAIAAYTENTARADLTPLEEAAALAAIRDLGANPSAPELAKLTGQPDRRIRRLLRLHEAPQLVKDAVAPGVMVDIAGEDRQPKRERRRLDLLAALEFTRLHEHHLRAKAGTADERTTTALTRALRDSWGLRRIQRYVDDTLNPRTSPKEPITDTHPAPTPRSVPPKDQGTDERGAHEPRDVCSSSSDRLTLYLSRLKAASLEQLSAAQDWIDDVRQVIAAQMKLKGHGA